MESEQTKYIGTEGRKGRGKEKEKEKMHVCYIWTFDFNKHEFLKQTLKEDHLNKERNASNNTLCLHYKYFRTS